MAAHFTRQSCRTGHYLFRTCNIKLLSRTSAINKTSCQGFCGELLRTRNQCVSHPRQEIARTPQWQRCYSSSVPSGGLLQIFNRPFHTSQSRHAPPIALVVIFKFMAKAAAVLTGRWGLRLISPMVKVQYYIQCVPEKRKPINQVNFSKNYKDLCKQVYIVTNLSYPLSFDTRYKKYWPCMAEHEPFEMVMSKLICAE